MTSLTQRLHLGRALYWGYYVPKGLLRKYIQRDPVRRAIDEQARIQMEQAAYQLPPITLDPGDRPFEIYFLSGARFWYQTCFCAYSMIQQAQVYLRPVIYDDGTLEAIHRNAISRIFPDVRIVSYDTINQQLDQHLPSTRFPWLRSRRLNYPNLRKLTDIHINSSGWKLVLDSDMVFFRKPTFLLEWLRSPQSPCHMVDIDNAYGYSAALMRELAGTPIPNQINVGICGLQSDSLDWDELEYWCKTLIERECTNYYQEQAMIAMLMARAPRAIASASDYIVLPTRQEAQQPKAVLHHYVADSKPWYFRYGWQHVMHLE
ncbi:MAG: hypothetical protein SFY66_20215 [Oculatellaceae cyanobacterium bins.114]|nr:hypothetical protein [Oculatellaceae cyanobacterium bins.114]